MYRDLCIAAVIPARNEAQLIGAVLETLPALVDRVYVIDDASTDTTAEEVLRHADTDRRVHLLRCPSRRGVGGAIARGYREALADGCDIAVVLAGDGQMDPADLETVIRPVAEGRADYVKGNRFAYPGGARRIPTVRKLGNFVLSVLTKIVTGYWHVSDSQCGYTAIHRAALSRLDLDALYPSYGYPNDLLGRLNVLEQRVAEIPVNPRYRVGERSKMRVAWVILPILWLLTRVFLRRLVQRYVVSNGHPLVFAFGLSFLSLASMAGLSVYLLVRYLDTGWVMKAALIAASALLILGTQLLITAFSMDQEANRHLCVRLRPGCIPGPGGNAEDDRS
ncbi:MAG: glycosyltransferase family 2 protein [bacterium]